MIFRILRPAMSFEAPDYIDKRTGKKYVYLDEEEFRERISKVNEGGRD